MEEENIITEECLAEENPPIEEKLTLTFENDLEVSNSQKEEEIELPEEISETSGNFDEENSQEPENIVEEDEIKEKTDEKIEEQEILEEDLIEKVEEDEPVEIFNESKEVVISDEGIVLESGIEIKYTSLQLKEFPIKFSNFSSRLTFDEIISIGTTSIKIGESIFNNVALKILVYSKFKLLEIKTREFKLALSIDLINDEQTLIKKDDFFKYEIFSKLKTSRLNEIVNLFKRIFSGETIEFKYNKLMGNISFENRIEVYKFTVLSESIETYKEVIKELALHREKNIGDMKDSFYTLFLLGCSLKGEKLASWINFRISNNYNIHSGDKVIFERVHKLKLNGIPFDLKEHIKILEPISQREITSNNEICCYRKAVEINLEQIKKSDMKR